MRAKVGVAASHEPSRRSLTVAALLEAVPARRKQSRARQQAARRFMESPDAKSGAYWGHEPSLRFFPLTPALSLRAEHAPQLFRRTPAKHEIRNPKPETNSKSKIQNLPPSCHRVR